MVIILILEATPSATPFLTPSPLPGPEIIQQASPSATPAPTPMPSPTASPIVLSVQTQPPSFIQKLLPPQVLPMKFSSGDSYLSSAFSEETARFLVLISLVCISGGALILLPLKLP